MDNGIRQPWLQLEALTFIIELNTLLEKVLRLVLMGSLYVIRHWSWMGVLSVAR